MDQVLSELAGGNTWKAYCISAPSSGRRETFQSWAEEIGLTFTFWDAVDAASLDPDVLVQKAVHLSYGFVHPEATATRLTHQRLWEHILTKESDVEVAFILEDTAGFVRANADVVKAYLQAIQVSKPDWSILQLGFGSMVGMELHLFQRRVPPGIYRVDSTDQAHALIYTQEALAAMLDLSQEEKYKTRTVDGLLMAFIQKKKGHILAPKTPILEQVGANRLGESYHAKIEAQQLEKANRKQ